MKYPYSCSVLQRTELGQIMMAIDNIADACHKRLDVPMTDLTLEQKLRKIKVSHKNMGPSHKTGLYLCF